MSKSILIVEDELSIMKALSIKLHNAGFQSDRAKDAENFLYKRK